MGFDYYIREPIYGLGSITPVAHIMSHDGEEMTMEMVARSGCSHRGSVRLQWDDTRFQIMGLFRMTAHTFTFA